MTDPGPENLGNWLIGLAYNQKPCSREKTPHKVTTLCPIHTDHTGLAPSLDCPILAFLLDSVKTWGWLWFALQIKHNYTIKPSFSCGKPARSSSMWTGVCVSHNRTTVPSLYSTEFILSRNTLHRVYQSPHSIWIESVDSKRLLEKWGAKHEHLRKENENNKLNNDFVFNNNT